MFEDYKIVVRTYKRPELFYKYTYSMLERQGIDTGKKLIIVLANNDELVSYSNSLEKMKYDKIVFSGVGAKQAIEAGSNAVPKGTPTIFMDDDLETFFEFTDHPTNDKKLFVKDSTNLEKYILDGFKTIQEEKLGSFSFNFMPNPFYLKGKPFKENRPYKMPGGFFGIFNDIELVATKVGHTEETQRSVQHIEKFGSILIYNWCGFKTQTGSLEGGMQVSNDRGIGEEKLKKTHDISWEVYNDQPLIRKFCKEPQFMEHTQMWELVLKPLNSIKKIHEFEHNKWPDYFGDKVIQQSSKNTLF